MSNHLSTEVETEALSVTTRGSSISPPREGDRLGRFVLEQPVGHGAMATVFRALDSSLGRRVAIKILNPAIATQTSGAERFRREGMAVAALRHPNIVEVYDFVPAAGHHSAYLVQELILGETLQALLEKRKAPLVPEVAALLAADVAEALSAAHSRGVVHRDVKPANIMLERQQAGARVVLADFGVAHMGDLSTMTATGAMVGSPAYMSPEQARGLSVGPQVDVWALGILLYQLTTARLPFVGRDPITVITSICKGDYKRPGQIDARVGPELDRIIVGCLRPQPAERFASAAEVANLLRECAARVGLVRSQTVLRRLLDDPEALENELKPKLAEDAVANARKFMRRRQLARALAELGRATAYVPKHSEALRLIESLSVQRRWTRGLLATAVVVAAVGIGSLAYRERTSDTSTEAVAVEGLAMSGATENTPSVHIARPPSEELSRDDNTESSPSQPTAADVAQKPAKPPAKSLLPLLAKPSRGRSSKVSSPGLSKPASHAAASRTSTQAVSDQLPAPSVPALQANPDPPPDVGGVQAPAATSATTAAAANTASVRLFARFAFCFPSLDADNARKAPPRSYTVAAGAHEVYCALTQDGPRLHAGTLHVRPGARLDVNIVPNAQGKPKLSETPH